MRSSFSSAALFAFSLLLPLPTFAQTCTEATCSPPASFSEHVALISINSLIGGVTAGLVRLVGGEPLEDALVDGFFRGAIGGGISYAGKRVAVQGFDGAGFLGREIAAIGASTTANAADGIAPLDRLMLPLGPIPARLLITKNGTGRSVRPVVDLLSTAGMLYGLAVSGYSLDLGASLSGGAAVFREDNPYPDELDVRMLDVEPEARGGKQIRGATAIGGTIFASHLASDLRILAHERVHVLQFDFLTASLGDRTDTWVTANAPSVDRLLKLNLVPTAFGAVNLTMFSLANHDAYPWEREAILLSGHR